MTTRDRFLAAIHNEKADRMPCQVHSWMGYYLNTYLGGMDQWAAYDHFGMDAVIYVGPNANYTDQQNANWQSESTPHKDNGDGTWSWQTTHHTPEGDLTVGHQANPITGWITKPPIESEQDWELHEKYAPVPTLDWSLAVKAKDRLGEKGIVRGGAWGFGQGSPWQDLCILMDTVPVILAAKDKPDWVHHALSVILSKRLEAIEKSGNIPVDIIECGGGAGSNTVISPDMHEEFCLPYDQKQHAAIHEKGPQIVYHLCGGVMQTLDLVAQNGADGLETMTPPGMGGDCDLEKATKQVGDKLFFIGGFDQSAGFENGSPEAARDLVLDCHEACPDGGYICAPSDHFFHGDPESVQAFSDAAKDCHYN